MNNMKKSNRKYRLLWLLIVLLAVVSIALVGCNGNTGGGNAGGGEEEWPDVGLDATLDSMQSSLIHTRKQVGDANVYSVDSKYSFDFAEFKFSMTLNANFNLENPAESTIYFKLFDDEENVNRIMTYYAEGTLYLDLLGEKSSYPNFGASSTFQLFYEAVRAADLSQLLYTEEFTAIIGNIALVSSYIDKNNVIDHVRGENGKYYEFKEINLDSMKEDPNKLLEQFFAPVGDKLDALTIPVMGFPFSRVAGVKISTWTVDKISMSTEGDLMETFDFRFSGALNSRENYDLTGNCRIGFSNREIAPANADDPFADADRYPDGGLGKYGFTGTLTLNGLAKAEYDVDILLKTDENDNNANKLSMLLKNFGGENVAGSLYYKDGNLYADLGELMDVLGNGFGLKELGFPKVKTAKFNLSQNLGALLAELEQLIRAASGGGGFEFDQAARNMILKKLSSDKEGYLNLVIDKEIATYFAGGEENVVSYLAKNLGIDEATAERYFKSEVFDRVFVRVRINFSTKNVIVSFNDGDNDVMTLSLTPSEFDEARLDEILTKASSGFDEYNDFITPEDLGVRMEGAMYVTTEADFSKFFGAFIGDAYGKNTPVVLNSTALRFRVEGLEKFDGSYLAHAKVWRDTETDANTYFELWAREENGVPTCFVDYRMIGLKYRIPAEEIRRALSLALGEDNLLVTGDLIEIFSRILSVSNVRMEENDVAVTIYETSDGNDPLYEIFGVKGLTLEARAAVRYHFEDGTFDFGNADDYIVPELEMLPDLSFESLYDASWFDTVRLKGSDAEMFIPYDPESVRIVDDKTFYIPTGRLFGQEIRYYLRISGGKDGTKEVVGIKNDSLTIDPWAETPLKDTIEVYFKDGTEGRLPYVIEGFSDSLIHPQGMDRAKYTVRFGTENSILFKTLDLYVEIEVRTLDVSYPKEGDLTIVGENLNVNPLKFYESPYDILPSTMKLRFQNLRDGTISDEEVFNTVWEFDYSALMTVTGGAAVARLTGFSKSESGEVYKIPSLGYRVIVQPKQFDYILIGSEKGKNVYTVDVLTAATYKIPSYSSKDSEIRIYFKDGTYSTIGEKNGFSEDAKRNGYLSAEIDWVYKEAKNIAENGSVKPLGDTNVNTATYTLQTSYAGYSIEVARFDFRLEVQEPAASLVRAGTTTGVIENVADGNAVTRVRGNFDYHAVDFGQSAEKNYELPFRYEPYSPKSLPSVVNLKIDTATVQGEKNIVERSYPVLWQTTGNILTDDGRLLYPSAEDMNFRAIGMIGDGKIRLELSVVIDNVKSVYRSVKYYYRSEDGKRTEMDASGLKMTAFDPYLLPNYIELTLENDKKVEVSNVRWNWAQDNTPVKQWSEERYRAYLEFLKTGEGEFDILEYYRNPSDGDGVGYRFDNHSESYTIQVSVSTTETNIYENTIEYTVGIREVADGRILTPYGNFDGTRETIDPYTESASALEALLAKEGGAIAPVRLTDSGDAAYYPVVWDTLSKETLLARLKSGDNASDVTLTGKIFQGVEGMELSVVGVFSVVDRSVTIEDGGIRFSKLDALSASDAESALSVENGEKTLNVTLKRPYALFASGGEMLTPSAYLKTIFKNVSLIFPGGIRGEYATRFDFLGNTDAEFDLLALDFSGNAAATDVEFLVYFSDKGSTEDRVRVHLSIVSDIITETGFSLKLDRFEADGSLRYPDGYLLGDSVEVTFSASGKLTLPVKSWTVSQAPSGSFEVGSTVKSIPETEFTGFAPRIYKFISALSVGAIVAGGVLRDTQEILYNVEINTADIRATEYSGVVSFTHNGREYALDAKSGTVTFDSVFDFNGFLTDGKFDPAKMPSVITPNRTGSYGQNNVFTVRWNAEAMPAEFDSFYTEDGVLAATAEIKGYGGSVQTIALYVRIEQKDAVSISKEGFDFQADGEGGFVLKIDPYAEQNGFPMWETTLPDTLDVGLSANGEVSYSVSKASYKDFDGAPVDPRLFYRYNAFEATGTDSYQIVAVLEDGSEFPLTVSVLNRTVKSVAFPYRTETGINTSENTIYIDPYDTAFTGLPTTATVNFEDGISETLPIELLPNDPDSQLSLSYLGGAYDYTFRLYGYRYDESGNPIRVENPQIVPIRIVVADRALKAEAIPEAGATLYVDDAISYRLSDLTVGKNLSAADFETKTQTMPADFAFSIPSADAWYDGNKRVTDDDMVPGRAISMTARLSDREAGQEISFRLALKTMRYDAIGVLENGAFQETEVIPFDVFNGESVSKTYTLRFLVSDPTAADAEESELLVEYSTVQNDGRRRIWWTEEVLDAIGQSIGGTSQIAAKFYFGNPAKSARYDSNTLTFRFMQIDDLTVDFGFNTETAGTSGKTVFVYDPLNPVFPEEAAVTGVIGGERIDLGVQRVFWNGFTPDGKFGYASVSWRITILSASTPFRLDHYAEILTLDRTGFSMIESNDFTESVTLDPIDAGAYDQATDRYNLPRDFTIEFKASATDRKELRDALRFYGDRFYVSGAAWWLGLVDGDGIRKIAFEGNENNPWPMVLIAGTFKSDTTGAEFTVERDTSLPSTDDRSANPFHTTLIVKNRTVVRTNLTGERQNGVFYADKAQFSLDPYNPDASLPDEITVAFRDAETGETERAYKDLKWSYNKNDIYNEMIEGVSAPEKSYISVELKLMGDKIVISFPVKARPLSGEGKIEGGTFYVDYGTGDRKEIFAQLPKQLYFNFGYAAGMNDYTAVPVKFSESVIPVGAKLAPGVPFTAEGVIGVSMSGNANFTITVIPVAPKLYALADVKETDGMLVNYRRLDYSYDAVPVPVNSSGNVVGSQTVKELLPKYLWLGDGVDPLKINASEFVYSGAEAVGLRLRATYSFKTNDTVNPYLAANKEGGSSYEIEYTLPLQKYDASTILEEPTLSLSGLSEDGYYHYALGKTLLSSDFPKAVYNGNEYGIFWDFSAVSVNASGGYAVEGRLIVSDERVYTYSAGVYIDRVVFESSDIFIEASELQFTYSGIEKSFNVKLTNVIREDGSVGAPNYRLLYAKEGSSDFISTPYLDAGRYVLRVVLDDRNAEGHRDFQFEITKWRVTDISWGDKRSFEYREGESQSPTVKNLPDWVKRTLSYREVDEDGIQTPLAGAPTDAGTYIVSLTIPTQDNCEANEEPIAPIEFVIRKKAAEYSVVSRMAYNGNYRHVTVNGLPAILENGMSVDYRYYEYRNGNYFYIGTDMIRNAGSYMAVVNVNGGKNYESASEISGIFTVDKATLTVTVSDVESYYLQSVLPFTTGVRYSSPMGSDTLGNFSSLKLTSDVTERSVPGRYPFGVAEGSLKYSFNGVEYDNYDVLYVGLDTAAYVVKMNEGVRLIQNETELREAIASLKPKDTVSFYLEAGSYGEIALTVNADVTLTGCYLEDGSGLAVEFDGIRVERGSLKLALVSLKPRASKTSVYIGSSASDVTIENSELKGAEKAGVPKESTGIYAARGFGGALTIDGGSVSGYAVGISVASGSLKLSETTVSDCGYGVVSESGDLSVERSLFERNTAAALTVNGTGDFRVRGSRFNYNVVAVKYTRALTAEQLEELNETGENVYASNGKDVYYG